MRMLSRNNIKSPEEQKLGEGGDDKQVIKLMWPNMKKHALIQKKSRTQITTTQMTGQQNTEQV